MAHEKEPELALPSATDISGDKQQKGSCR